MLQPWRSVGLITALVGSFAVPAFMVASADVFLESASDSITRQVLDDNPSGLDVTVLATGRLSADAVDALDEQMRIRLRRVGRLTEPRRTVYVSNPDLGLQTPPIEDGVPAQTIIGSGGRFLADDRAVTSLQVVDGDPAVRGIWISERRAERLDLTPGALVAVNDSAPVPVAGVFANLWEGEQDPYWDELPLAVVPTFSTVFGGPTFEVIVMPESLIYEFGLDGVARWDAPVGDRPDTHDELTTYVARLRGLERSFTESDDMAAAIAGFSGAGGRVPDVVTDAFDIRFDVDRIIDELDQPIATTAIGGILLGLVVTAAGAGFAVRKRQTEMRLLRADGDASWRFAARALVQYLPPAIVGGVLGAVAGVALIAIPGDGGSSRADAVDVGAIVRTVALGLLVAAAVTGFAASRLLSTRSAGVASVRLTWLLPIVGLAVAAWIQVGSSGEPGEVDPLVIAFPLLGLVAGVGLVVLGVRWVMQRVHRTGGGLPPGLFLAWRRITAAESGAVLLAASMGIALGLIVFSTTLAASLETATSAKVDTVVGGQTRVQLVRAFDGPLPDDTTLVRVQTVSLTIGDSLVEVVVIDPATYADAVSWDPLFGGSAEELVDSLAGPVDADVAAVVVDGRPVPDDAGFGTSNVVSYEVVGTVAAVPLASAANPTLVVSADQVDAIARADHEARRPPDVEPDEWAAQFRSPLDRARQMVVSQLDEPTLTAYFTTNGVAVREVVTASEQEDLVGTRAAKWTFRYLGVLAVIAALAAAGTLFFYLSEQRSSRQLSTVMAERIGLRRLSAAVAAVAEVLGLVVVAFAAGTVVGLALAGRVFDRFEPAPRVPPDVSLQPSWSLLAGLAVAAVALVVVASLVNRWLASRRSYGEVLRGG